MQRQTHIEYGDDGGVISADYSGNILSLGDLGGDQLREEEMGKIWIWKMQRKQANGEIRDMEVAPEYPDCNVKLIQQFLFLMIYQT